MTALDDGTVGFDDQGAATALGPVERERVAVLLLIKSILEKLTQSQCDWIAGELNDRPRERYNFWAPNELFL